LKVETSNLQAIKEIIIINLYLEVSLLIIKWCIFTYSTNIGSLISLIPFEYYHNTETINIK